MLTPSLTPSPDDNVESATSGVDEVPSNPVELSAAPAFDAIEPSTERTCLQARMQIFGDRPSGPSSEEAFQAQAPSSSMVVLQDRRERLQRKAKKELKQAYEKVVMKVKKVRVAEQIAFQRMVSVKRRSVNSESHLSRSFLLRHEIQSLTESRD